MAPGGELQSPFVFRKRNEPLLQAGGTSHSDKTPSPFLPNENPLGTLRRAAWLAQW